MAKLTGAQRRHLRGLAHGLKPVVQVGKLGLTTSLLESCDAALASHELIKVRFGELRDQKREACDLIAAQLGCEQVGMIGHVAIFYRPASDPEERKITLPQ